jgi:hypothetical protein
MRAAKRLPVCVPDHLLPGIRVERRKPSSAGSDYNEE